jgi:hypothetical protein
VSLFPRERTAVLCIRDRVRNANPRQMSAPRPAVQTSLPHFRGEVASGQAAATSLDPPQRAISESLVRKLSPELVASRGGRGSKWADLSQAEGWNEVACFRANLDAKESVMTGRPGDRSLLAPVGDPAGNLSGMFTNLTHARASGGGALSSSAASVLSAPRRAVAKSSSPSSIALATSTHMFKPTRTFNGVTSPH